MHRPVHFEYQVPDCTAAIEFYEKTFGWKFQRFSEGEPEYHVIDTGQGDGINGGLMKSPDGQPRVVNVLEVSDVDAHCDKITAAGGQVVVPKMAIPGVGWVAYASDPGGILFGVYTHDPEAK